MSALEGLTPDERAFLMNAPGGWSQAVVDTCDALAARVADLEAQAQRDFALAAEWKAALEAERVSYERTVQEEWAKREALDAQVAQLTARLNEVTAELTIAWEDDPLVPELRAALEAERAEHQALKDRVARAVDAWEVNDDGPPSLGLQAALEALRG